MTETVETIAAWGNATFGPVTGLRAAVRANEEMSECIKAYVAENASAGLIEAADVVICLCRIPGLWEAVEQKMAVNRSRTWNVGPDGCGYHVKSAASNNSEAV